MHVDDKLVVPVSDKPVELKPLIDKKKDIPVCVRPMIVVLIQSRCIWCHGFVIVAVMLVHDVYARVCSCR
jgi:hypothetical protein